MDAQVEDLLGKLRVEEKVGLLSGCGMWEAGGVPRLGLPTLRMSDGPHGARGLSLSGDDGVALAPCEAAMAASFNEALIEEVGSFLGEECVRRGAHVLLGPCLNLQRWPLCGRHFECFSEDAYLSSRAAVAYVRGVQRHVAACAKHFVCNDQEDYRHTLSSVIDERTLREVYLAPFEAAVVEAGVESIMCGYNRLNGKFCTENAWLLQNVLRAEWGFSGFVLSDWFGNRSTVPSIHAGLNVEMPGTEPRHYGGHLLQAVRAGEVPSELLDERCRPVLRTLLRHRTVATSSDAQPADASARRDLLRRTASESLVLLRNEGGTLPLDVNSLRTLAVIGPNAANTCVQGGGSSRVRTRQCANVLEVLQSALPSRVEILHEPGCFTGEARRTTAEFEALRPIGRGLATGQPAGLDAPRLALSTRLFDAAIRLGAWLSSKEWVRRCCVPLLALLGAKQSDPADMAARQARAAERERRQPPLAMVLAGCVPAAACVAAFTGGAAARALLAASAVLAGSAACMWLSGRQRSKAEESMLVAAERAAASADAIVLVLGTDGAWESEGMDQLHMRLLGRQNELVQRVVATARGPVSVVLNVGSPKKMPWIGDVQAVLLAHFGGEEMAPAVVDALLGASCPAGRLPYSWPARLGDSPAVAAAAGQTFPGEARYLEGLKVGYRGFGPGGLVAAPPLFAFGHGLSYTVFSYGTLEAAPLLRCSDAGGPSASVQLTVRNSGSRAGAEVVQLFSLPESGGAKVLCAFARTAVLEPGAEATVRLSVGPRGLGSWYNEDQACWQPPAPGARVRLEAGGSSASTLSSTVLALQ